MSIPLDEDKTSRAHIVGSSVVHGMLPYTLLFPPTFHTELLEDLTSLLALLRFWSYLVLACYNPFTICYMSK